MANLAHARGAFTDTGPRHVHPLRAALRQFFEQQVGRDQKRERRQQQIAEPRSANGDCGDADRQSNESSDFRPRSRSHVRRVYPRLVENQSPGDAHTRAHWRMPSKPPCRGAKDAGFVIKPTPSAADQRFMDEDKGVVVRLDTVRRGADKHVAAEVRLVASAKFRARCKRCDWIGDLTSTEADAVAHSKAHVRVCPVFVAAIRASDRRLLSGKSALIAVAGLVMCAYGMFLAGLFTFACGAAAYWWFDRSYRPLQ
jgi:hypothetical protein